ncbi:hypothetical protein [Clostridium ljungdahlii]|uniref:hypothetical protein n=1 Tax=Clostridium ljungdahlii TaxID=1538 RepID=UPI000B03CB86|nr:hypothetical protein [Clostridium ljungdahlii]
MKKILFTPGIASIEALGSITRLIAIADEIKKKQQDCSILFRAAGREADYAAACEYKVIQGYKPPIPKLWQQKNCNTVNKCRSNNSRYVPKNNFRYFPRFRIRCYSYSRRKS